MAGYSSTPLAKKLGIKPGCRLKLVNAPTHYFGLFADMPDKVQVAESPKPPFDLIHFFTKDGKELYDLLPVLKAEIVPNGIIWVSWPKKAAKILTNVTEDLIRDLALKTGLVDVKVCAVDDVWSGLKLVIPVKDRAK